MMFALMGLIDVTTYEMILTVLPARLRQIRMASFSPSRMSYFAIIIGQRSPGPTTAV